MYKTSEKLVGTYRLPKWADVLAFLEGLPLREENGELLISKKEGEKWKVEANFEKKNKPIKLTTRGRGVGLFDLNW